MIPSIQKLTIEWSKWAWGPSMISEFSVQTVANTESPLAGCFFILEAFPGFLTSDTGFILRKDFWQLTALVLKIFKKCINIPKVPFLCCYWVRLFWFSVMYMIWPSYSFSFLIHGKRLSSLSPGTMHLSSHYPWWLSLCLKRDRCKCICCMSE